MTKQIDPEQAAVVPFGQAVVSPNTGHFRVLHPLDFDLSPGTSVGGNPALVWNSDAVSPRPILEATLASDAAGSVPSSIDVQLKWNGGTPQSWTTFTTTGHAAGDDQIQVSVSLTVPGKIAGGTVSGAQRGQGAFS